MDADGSTDWRAQLRTDPVMADLIEAHGPVELSPAADPFRRLCVTIVNQQLSTASADAIRERAFAALGEVTPERVLAADRETLRDAGLSATKVDYLRNAATAFRERELEPEALSECAGEAVVDRLTEIKGIGRWSAEMYLIFALGREDVLPLGDLAIRRAITDLYGPEERGAMRSVGEQWRPYRSYATLYLWRHWED